MASILLYPFNGFTDLRKEHCIFYLSIKSISEIGNFFLEKWQDYFQATNSFYAHGDKKIAQMHETMHTSER